jgi:hypothetical protein
MNEAEQNAIRLLQSLTPEQSQQIADLAALIYSAGFDHGAGQGNQLADTCWSETDARRQLRQLVETASAQYWEQLTEQKQQIVHLTDTLHTTRRRLRETLHIIEDSL